MGYVRPSVTMEAARAAASGVSPREPSGRAEGRAFVGLLVLLLTVGGGLWHVGRTADAALAAELRGARDLSVLALTEATSALALRTGDPPAAAVRALLHVAEPPGQRTRYRPSQGPSSFGLEAAHVGESAESCVFDRDGVLLSDTRHAAQLLAQGRVDAQGRFALHRPLSPRGSATAPIAPVAAALAGRSGVMLTGYPDQRGVTAVGAYTYVPALAVGVLHQRDRADAYRETWLCQLALVLAGLGLAAAWLSACARPAGNEAAGASLEVDTYGQYTLGRKLGEGGMGVVYEASHRLLRRPTALKLLRVPEGDAALTAESLGRFEREVQLTSQLTHPNTIVIYDYGQTDDGTFYYAMEYVEGVDLERWVRLDGPLPAARIIHLALQICGSLAEAHAKGLIHRDIKPANILVCERGGIPDFIKVLDFGLVKHVNGPSVSHSNLLVGTPLYMAPELLRSPGAASPRSDVYSLGAVLHWLATAMTVPDATLASAARLPRQPAGESAHGFDPYAGLPLDLERVLMRCIDPDPYERPGNVEELASALAACRDAGRWTTPDAKAYWASRGPQLQALLARPVPNGARTVQAS
jgi:eukaryotic-like serine/threonine-protein kinase